MRRIIFYAVALILCIFMSAGYSFGLTPAQKHKRAHSRNLKKETTGKYAYIKNHDMNHDGKVDNKDRLMWLNRRKSGVDAVLVSKENEDILESMDTNGNGSVEQVEIQAFYNKYDINSNGILENNEINAATD